MKFTYGITYIYQPPVCDLCQNKYAIYKVEVLEDGVTCDKINICEDHTSAEKFNKDYSIAKEKKNV